MKQEMGQHKEEFIDLIHYQQVQLQRTGVEVHLNTPVSPTMVASEELDVVLVPTGTRSIVPTFPRLTGTRWMTAYDLLEGRTEVSTQMAFQTVVCTIGDCIEPREVVDAVYEGFEVGRTV